MSYMTYALLTEDVNFGRRSRSCIAQQANSFINDGRADIKALATDLLKGAPAQMNYLLAAICAGPQFDTAVDNGDGTIDSTKITDNEILSQCQAVWPQAASLYYDSTGAPLT